MMSFHVTTWEQVEAVYIVKADSEEAARAKFKPGGRKLIDWDGVEQVSYQAFDLQIESVES